MTSLIVTKSDACSDILIECSARCTNRLTKRVDRSETLAGAVIDHDEDCRPALICHTRSAVDCPHLIWSFCDDCSSCVRGPRDDLRRVGASKLLSRMMRKMRPGAENTRISARRHAPILRYPSPTNGELRSIILISSSTCISAKHVLGPRFFLGVAPFKASTLCRCILDREIFYTVQTRLMPKGFKAEGDIVALIAMASAVENAGRLPVG